MFDERLMKYFGWVREFPEFEYELKFDAPLKKSVSDFLEIGENDRYSPLNIFLIGAFKTIEGTSKWDMDNAWNYNRLRKVDSELVVSHYCGDMVAVQRLVKHSDVLYTTDKNLFDIKIKGESIPLNFGIKGEKQVMKRKESVESATLSDILREMTGRKFEGSVEKFVEYYFVQDEETNRVFELSYATCNSKFAQLEVEYVGFDSDFIPKNLNDERQLISDLINLGNSLVNVKPSKKNKRDFISR